MPLPHHNQNVVYLQIEEAMQDAWADLLYDEVLESCISSIARASIVDCQKEKVILFLTVK